MCSVLTVLYVCSKCDAGVSYKRPYVEGVSDIKPDVDCVSYKTPDVYCVSYTLQSVDTLTQKCYPIFFISSL